MSIWIPPDSDFALALREPNLLVPWDKNLGNVKPREELQPVSIMLLRPGMETVDLCGVPWSVVGSPVFFTDTASQAAGVGTQGEVGIPQSRWALASSTSHYLRTNHPPVKNLPLGPFTLAYVALTDSGGQSTPAVCGWSGADDIVFYQASVTSSHASRVFWRDGGSATGASSAYVTLYNYTVEHFVCENDGSTINYRHYSNGVQVFSNSSSAAGIGPFDYLYLGSWESQSSINGSISDLMAFAKAFTPAEVAKHARDFYGFALRSANDTPYLFPVAGGGGVSQELTGNSSTSAVGTLGVSTEANVSVTPTGVASSSAIGTLSVSTEGSVSATPEGVSAASAVGTLGATAEINTSAELTGVSSSGAVGTITAEVGGGATANLSGNESATSVGTLGVSTEVNAFVDLLGNSATGAVGTLIVVTGLQVALSGNAATGAVGTLGVTAEVNASATLTGVGSSGAVGTLEITVPITTSVELTGASATGAIGSLTAVGAGQVWTEIPPVSTTWTEIS